MSPGWSFYGAPRAEAPPTPSANLNLTDPATWVAILTVVASIVVNAWPNLKLDPFIPQLSILVAGLVASVVMFSKHHYASGIAQAAGAAAAAGAALPPDSPPDLKVVAAAVDQVNSMLKAMVDGGGPVSPSVGLPVPGAPIPPGA